MFFRFFAAVLLLFLGHSAYSYTEPVDPDHWVNSQFTEARGFEIYDLYPDPLALCRDFYGFKYGTIVEETSNIPGDSSRFPAKAYRCGDDVGWRLGFEYTFRCNRFKYPEHKPLYSAQKCVLYDQCPVLGTEYNYTTQSCTCVNGRDIVNGSCEPPERCDAGQSQTFEVIGGMGTVSDDPNVLIDKNFRPWPLHQCTSGCDFLINESETGNPNIYWDDSPPGTRVIFHWKLRYVSTGDSCSSPPDNPPPDNPDPDKPPGGDGGGEPPGGDPENPPGGGGGGGSGGNGGGGSGPGGGGGGDPPGGSDPPGGGGGSGGGDSPGGGGGSGGGDHGGGGSGGGDSPGGGGSGGSGGGTDGDGSGSGDGSDDKPDPDCKTDPTKCSDKNPGGSLPKRPSLYEPKYPQGPSGVWGSRIGQLKGSPVFQLAGQLLPGIDSGAPPTCQIDVNFGRGMHYGTFQICPDAWVYDALRAIVNVLALIFAFRLVFGGA